jgi:uncharacterized protein
MIGSISEIKPLSTEEYMTDASCGIDDLSGVERKDTTTVALDFGRITLDETLALYLFGTPGQDRFWPLWNDLATGAAGAVVLVDTRRLQSGFASVDFFERRKIPFVVAVNTWPNSYHYEPEEVRGALKISPEVPIVLCKAPDMNSSKQVLLTLVEHISQGRLREPSPVS